MATLLNPITILLATLCLQWVSLSSAGPFAVKVPYVALGIVTLYMLTGPRKLQAAAVVARKNAVWVVPFAIYLAILTAVLQGTPGQNIAPRQIFFLVGSLALAACIAAAPRLRMSFRVGSVIGLVLFVIAIEAVARTIGLSWIDAISAFLRGNLKFVVYTFLRDVFNAVEPDADTLVGAATKNEVAVSVLVLALLVRSSSVKPARDYVGMGMLGFALIVLLLLNTRSVLIVAAVSVCLAAAIGVAFRRGQSLPSLFIKAIGAVGVLAVSIGLSISDQAASGVLSDRFSFDDNSSLSRVNQFQSALEQIQQHPFTGSGYFEVDGHVIHNLFLSSWVHVGLAGFALVTFFYLAIMVSWLAFIFMVVRRPRQWVLGIAPEWIAPLPIMPLFRVWLSGNAGHLFLGEWVALGIFFGCILANAREREKRFRLLRHAHAEGATNDQLPISKKSQIECSVFSYAGR